MKQVLQNFKSGETKLHEVPAPSIGSRELLIRTRVTLISASTERMLMSFGKANLVKKARQQPDKVRMVLEKIKTDGLLPTVRAVQSKLDMPFALGYCNVGVVMDVGSSVSAVSRGDRVISNGKHAEIVGVPMNLQAAVPPSVSDEEAAFTVIAAVGLQGIRLAQPTLGEAVVVTGLGLIGLVTVQLLRAHGCRVLGIDFDADRLALARKFGAEVVDLARGEDPLSAAQAFSRGRGVDAVLITAATTSNEPVHQAAQMCRKRGRVVLVGLAGLELSRADFYEKELSFQVSCSYGPGRYDANYEEKGQDYPFGFVRWTEQRNFEAVLDMMADGRLDVKPLISHRFSIDNAEKAYELVGGSEPSLGILLQYHSATEKADHVLVQRTVRLAEPPQSQLASTALSGSPVLAFIGAGNYSTGVLIPAFKAAGARLKVVASAGGVSGLHAGRKYGFEETTTDTDSLFRDADVNTVVITTRHDSHAHLVCRALNSGKHVFVEKPLALTIDELSVIERTYLASAAGAGQPKESRRAAPLLMVGFNRRFAPQVQKMRSLLESAKGPKAFVLTVNAGAIPGDHWSQDLVVGGGRIIGEACHFIDLLRYLAGSAIISHGGTRMAGTIADTATIGLRFEDGSIGTIHYFANGNKSYPKERLEVFASGRILQLDNFRKLTGFGWPGFRKLNLWQQDKGQTACAKAFASAVVERKPSPIPFEELIEVSRVTIEVAQSLG